MKKHGIDKFKSIISVTMLIIVIFISSAAVFTFDTVVTKADSFEESLSQFPESYWPYLRAYHEAYPAYIFVADYIDADFYSVVDAQVGRKKTYYSDYASWKACLSYNYNWSTGEWYSSEGGWTYTTREVIAYYLDPRNFISVNSPTTLFEFLCQSYTSDQTEAGLREMLAGSFMETNYTPNPDDPDDVAYGGDYAKVIMKAAEVSGVSPYVLAATIMLEQGISEESVMVYGQYPGYEGLYNFYNVAATGSTNTDVIINGLTYARNHGWTSRYQAIVQGAGWYSSGYLSNGQETYYYMDFNVKNGNYSHQYATSVFDSASKGKILGSAYENFTNTPLVFKIPVYNNMPDSAVSWPAENNNLNNYYFLNLSVSGLSPEFDIYTNYYDLNVGGNTVIGYTLPSGASYVGQSSFEVSVGDNIINLTVKSETGYTRDYYINVHATSNCTIYIGTGPTEPDTPSYTLGDVNGDGVIDVIDLARLKKYLLNKTALSEDEFKAADVDQSGTLDIIDLARIKKYLLGKISEF